MPTPNIKLTAELKLEGLRAQIKAGLEAIECGAFTELEDADLDAALDELTTSDPHRPNMP